MSDYRNQSNNTNRSNRQSNSRRMVDSSYDEREQSRLSSERATSNSTPRKRSTSVRFESEGREPSVRGVERPRTRANRTSAARPSARNASSENRRSASRSASRSLRTGNTGAESSRRPSLRVDEQPEQNSTTERTSRRQSERLASTGRKKSSAVRPSVRQSEQSAKRRASARFDDELEASAQQAETSASSTGTATAKRQTAHEKSSPNAASSAKPSKQKAQSTLDPELDASRKSALAGIREGAVTVFGGILVFGMILGLCFFLRPSVSKVENRELSTIEPFTLQGFLDGDWTGSISTWYSDTFPFRDKLIALDKRLESLYGFERDEQMYGNSVQADEIPSETGTSEKKEPVAPEEYDAWNLEADIQGQLMSGLYVKDGAVYATYGFTQEAADDYANAINGAADELDGTTKVYSILIPNNSGVLLSDDELTAMGGSNQAQAIQYYYDSYNDKVDTVETMDTLKEHKDDYIYFRTDHHWTALGAYYVYQSFCEEKGIEAHSIDDFEEQDFGDFLGSYYTELQLDSLAANPDTVQAWVPMGTNDMTYTDVDGGTVDWNVIYDVSEWDQGSQYNCFIGGDQPWSEIHNPDITDGSSCLVVKESYGNCFVPWLVDHYETVYVADYRYCNTNVVDFCKENDVDDLIILNNISIIGSTDVAGKIASIL